MIYLKQHATRLDSRRDVTSRLSMLVHDSHSSMTVDDDDDDDDDDTVYDGGHFAHLAKRTADYTTTLLNSQPSSAERRGCLRVLSWNVQMLRGIFAGQGGRPQDLVTRARKIAANICAIASTIDVVVLQEVWHEPARRVLTAALSDVSGFVVFAPKKKCGLLIASRHRHVCNMFNQFPARGFEAMAFSKGVTTTFLRLNDALETPTRVAIVLNAHTQSDYWSCGQSVRVDQIRRIRAVMERAVHECQGNGYILDRILLCGDLNVECGSDEYRRMMSGPFRGAIDLMQPPQLPISRPPVSPSESDRRFTYPTGRWRHNFFACCGEPSRYEESIPTKRLDYIIDLTPLIRHGVPPAHAHVDEGFVHQQLLRGIDGGVLSDHAPIVALSSVHHS